MNILFLHRNFPGQFKHLVKELAKDSGNKVVFITNNDETQIKDVTKFVYHIKTPAQSKDNKYLNDFEEAMLHGTAAAEVAGLLRDNGFVPDVIYGHSWGETMFMKDVYPNIPLICYFEWFYNSNDTDFDFFIKKQSLESQQQLRCKNSYFLQDLCSCDLGISPTEWQKSQFPKEFHNKIKVIHDGIDTDVCKPDKDAKFAVKGDLRFAAETESQASTNSVVPFVKNIELTLHDEVITYATRGMEPYRGFPNFIKAAEVLLKKRPKAQIVIAGFDEVFYGMPLEGKSYKDFMLENVDMDLSRVHFVGQLPFEDYIKLLQVSSVHVYLTVPFVLSWSILEAMSCGCCIVASDTPPVLEVIEDNENGLLFDFFNIAQLVHKIEYALENKRKIQMIKENARATILERYSLKKLLPKHIDLIKKFK